MKAILLVPIFISIFCYQTVYATSDSMSGTYTMLFLSFYGFVNGLGSFL